MKAFVYFLLLPILAFAQPNLEYSVTATHPYGKLNPEAAPETAQFAPLIGTCDCKSTLRNPDQSWAESEDMVWTFKYILNGHGIQDESWRADGSYSGSIRQFIADSSKWYVHWYSNKSPTASLPSWEGGKEGDNLVFQKEQTAPNAMDGFYRLTFSDITKKGFNWIGEWINKTETIIYPTWKITCIKRKD